MATHSHKQADVVVIGLGAAGGTTVMPLCEAGLDVVGIEAGGSYALRDFPADEIRNDIRNWLGRVKVNNEVPTQRLSPTSPTTPAVGPARMMNAVGGTSIHWTCQSWRLAPWDFQARSRTIARYVAGAPWPAPRSPWTGRSTMTSSSRTTTASSGSTACPGSTA